MLLSSGLQLVEFDQTGTAGVCTLLRSELACNWQQRGFSVEYTKRLSWVSGTVSTPHQSLLPRAETQLVLWHPPQQLKKWFHGKLFSQVQKLNAFWCASGYKEASWSHFPPPALQWAMNFSQVFQSNRCLNQTQEQSNLSWTTIQLLQLYFQPLLLY